MPKHDRYHIVTERCELEFNTFTEANKMAIELSKLWGKAIEITRTPIPYEKKRMVMAAGKGSDK